LVGRYRRNFLIDGENATAIKLSLILWPAPPNPQGGQARIPTSASS